MIANLQIHLHSMLYNENKAGIYIHIPFCKKACVYCNFHFSTSLLLKPEMLKAIQQEIIERKHYLPNKKIQSIYFGGGTPSLLSGDEVQTIIDLIRQEFIVEPDAEITLEANPDDINAEYLETILAAGINRISIGIQSFDNNDLEWMNRSHDATQAENSLKLIAAAGFKKVTADLIYGIPGSTHEAWKKHIEKVIPYVNHISCYALTVEPKTVLQHLITKGKSLPVDENHTAEQFEILTATLKAAGFEHYEISNFAKNGAYAVHNTAYWMGNHYLGIGPSAHSYNGIERAWNISNNAHYVKNIFAGISFNEIEILTPVQQMNEMLLTSLRTMWGLDVALFRERFGEKNAQILEKQFPKLIQEGLLEIQNTHVFITERGKFLADGIISNLFFDDND